MKDKYVILFGVIIIVTFSIGFYYPNCPIPPPVINCINITSVTTLEPGDCIGIQFFRYNAEGDDRYNLNGEYVTFGNFCNFYRYGRMDY